MNIKEAAIKFNKTQDTIKKWCENGLIRGIKTDEVTGEYIIPNSAKEPYTCRRAKGDAIYKSIVVAVLNDYDVMAKLYGISESEFEKYITQLISAGVIDTYTDKDTGILYYCKTLNTSGFTKLTRNRILNLLKEVSIGVNIVI